VTRDNFGDGNKRRLKLSCILLRVPPDLDLDNDRQSKTDRVAVDDGTV
jgi:hypothetical protein